MSVSPYEEFGATAGGGGHVEQLVFDMPMEAYRDLDMLNNSSLNNMNRSEAHFYHARAFPREADTSALNFGTLAHCGVLEEESIFERYERIPAYETQIDAKVPKLTKAYREQVAAFRELVAPKIAVPIDEFDRMLGVNRAIKENANVFVDGRSEVVLMWRDVDTGLWCKGRADYLRFSRDTGTIYDLKTTRDCRDFSRSIATYGYDRQAAFYLRGCKALGIDVQSFWFVVVESEPPFGVMAAPLDPVTLADGELQVAELVKKVAQCEATGVYRNYEHPEYFAKPKYAYKHPMKEPAQMTAGGVTIAI